ncbi:MAG: peptide chain release factor 2 [Lachnospiraceae bacterium]|nr:peptide chain release factor 2 [Lachnospiraceae bacterium]
MVELDAFKATWNGYKEPLLEVRDSLDLDNKKFKLEDLKHNMEVPGFWDDVETSQNVMKQVKTLEAEIDGFQALSQQYEDIETLIEMGYEEEDESLIADIEEELHTFEEQFEKLRISTLLTGEYDESNAILSLHAGAGGTEACDWVNMLLRMYSKWADSRGFQTELLDYVDGDETGYKSVTMQINGENAYGYLRSEHGVHRLVRISPFNAAGKRQTTFAACDVMPDIEADLDVEINPDDLRIDFYRSSGAGGQHINKTSSAVRITHNPTGIVVQCQNERSQHMNKDKAMKMLKARLYLLKKAENEQKVSGIRGDVKENGWGSQIRSYVMHPYSLVKDHRTQEETANVNAVMDGGIDRFINAYLKWQSIQAGQKKEEE